MTDNTEFWKKAWAARKLLTFEQAALIIAGIDPGSTATPLSYVQPILDQIIDDGWKKQHRENIAIGGESGPRPNSKDLIDSTFVKEWMIDHGFEENLIWTDVAKNGHRQYLDPKHPHFSKRLAAAVLAWEAVTADPALLKGSTPKIALRQWIEENQGVLGMGEAEFSDSALDDICLVANWNEKGGAAKSVPKRQRY